MASSGRSTPYHERMVTDTDYVLTSGELNNERLELSYKTVQENTFVIRRECGQTLGRVRVRTVVNY